MRVVPEPGKRPRLDRALADALAREGIACTRSRLSAAFAQGHVCVEGRAVKPSLRVEEGLEVRVRIPRPAPLRAFAEDIPLAVLFEDDDVLVVDKPAGMPVHVHAVRVPMLQR